MCRRTLFLLFPFLAATACRDSEVPLSPGETPAAQAMLRADPQDRPPYELPRDALSRWDAPWWTMGDAELADSIAAAGGRTFIGFKEADARGGVDDWGRVLVSDTTAAAGKAYLRSLGLTFQQESKLTPTVVTVIDPSLVSMLRANPLIDYVEPVLTGRYIAQDTTWNVRRVRAPEAWPSSTGSGVKLLIIDSGIPNDHPDLSPAVIQTCDGTNGLDQLGHGTHVSGIAAAVDNTEHVIGVSHGVTLWSSKVGTLAPSAEGVRCAVEFGRINGTFAMNMSVSITPLATLTDQIKGAYADGLFMAAAAGNTNGGAVTYPATLAEVVAVTATDINNNRAGFAAIGPEVELAAPGVSITSTSLPSGSACTQGGLTGVCSGTSMASPHVAAAAAILKSFNAAWTNVDIRGRLQNSAVDLGAAGRDNEFGYGLLNVQGALNPLTVSIDGPTFVYANQTETWTAVVSGGATPYAFQWYVDGVPAGNDQSLTMDTGGTDFELRVEVTDAAGTTKSDNLFVTVSNCTPPEIIC